ncbi:MAG: MucBP domain-containing protein [Bacilli bacterium]|nr:MucBP domain-containing protein [Bacilli bacterium]
MDSKKKKNLVFILLLIAILSSIIVCIKVRNISYTNEIELAKYEVFNPVLDNEENIEGTDYVKFDAFFLSDEDNNGEAEGYRGISLENNKSEKLYFSLQVNGDVTLKNASISFINDNVTVSGTVPKSSAIPTSYYSDDFDTITLSDVSNGVSSFFFLNVTPSLDLDLNKFSGTNKVVLTGQVYDNVTGETTNITKEINYDVNVQTNGIITHYTRTNSSSEQNSFVVNYKVYVNEGYSSMPLLESHIEGSVSTLLGAKPTNVVIRTEGTQNFTSSFDEDNLTFSATKTAVIEDNVIVEPAYSFKTLDKRITLWYVDVTYERDEEASNEFVSLSASSWHVGIKDSTGATETSEKRQTIISQQIDALYPSTDGFMDASKVYLGDYVLEEQEYYVDKTPIMVLYKDNNMQEPRYEEMVYNQKYEVNSRLAYDKGGTANYLDKGTFFGNTDMSSYIDYSTIRVVKSNLYTTNQSFTVTDADTGTILFVITQKDFGKTLNFPANVHRIKIESNELPESSFLKYTFYFTKSFDVSKIDKTTFPTFNYGNITNRIETWQKISEVDDSAHVPQIGNAVLSEKSSSVGLTTDKTTYYRDASVLSIPFKLRIKTNDDDIIHSKWDGGVILLKIPELFIDLKNVNASSYGSNMTILSTEKFKSGDNLFIRIVFSGEAADIKLDFDGVVNPALRSDTVNFEVYGVNNASTIYLGNNQDIYDVDTDGNVNEIIAYDSKEVSISYPSEVTTWESLENYDQSVSTSYTPSPLIADVDPNRDEKDADLRISIQNNSSYNVKNVYVIGKTGYVNNTYQIGSGDLGTEFDSYMDGPITYDPSLNGNVKIYYSYMSEPSNDLNNIMNGWTETPADYKQVKSYMIVLDEDYELNVGQTISFVYPVELPVTTENLNKVSYFTHGAYFDYMTESGTYSASASGFKLGARIARLYNLKLNLYKKYSTNQKITGGTYKLYPINNSEDVQTITFNSNGYAEVENLYVDTDYVLKQITARTGAILDEEEREFRISNNQLDNSLSLSNSDNFRNISFVNNNEVDIELENEVTYWTILNSFDIDNNSQLDAVYEITGKNHENGIRVTTSSSGSNDTLIDFVPGEVYHVKQTYIDGYAKTKEFDFKVVRDKDDNTFDLTTRQAPVITRSGNCDSEAIFTANLSSYSLEIPDPGVSSEREIDCNLILNLDGYQDEYRLTGDIELDDDYSASTVSNVGISLSTKMNYTESPNLYNLSVGEYQYYLTQNIDLVSAKTKYRNNIIDTPLVGGSDYDLYITYNRGSYEYAYLSLNNLKLTNLSIQTELYQNKQKYNLQSSDNPNVRQLIASDTVDAYGHPILILSVYNKKMTKETFEIVKTDAVTGQPLPGSMFKISGPGYADNTLFSTDENGKATLDLYLSYSGNYSQVPGVGNNSDYPVNNVYTIEEVYAPNGYSINNSKVNFKIDANYKTNPNDPSADPEPTYQFTYVTNNKFKSTEIKNPLVFTAYVENYPLFNLVKKDNDTGEVLPNTYYKIEAYDKVTLELSPAKDMNGNIVGEKQVIDGETVYLIKTDNNGSITIGLSEGTYKLTEVIPSDEKYDISNEIIYFTVGENRLYQPRGAYIDSLVDLPDEYNYSNNNPSNLSYKMLNVFTTSDNGYLVVANTTTSALHVVKYNSNSEIEWDTPITYVGGRNVEVRYFDNDNVYYNSKIDPNQASEYMSSNFKGVVTEENDSYYIYFAQNADVRIDKYTGDILYNNGAKPEPAFVTLYKEVCPKTGSESPSQLIDGNDSEVYCRADSYNVNIPEQIYYSLFYDTNNTGSVLIGKLSKANVMQIGDQFGPYTRGSYNSFRLTNGTLITNESTTKDEFYITKFNKNGEFISAVPITDNIDVKFNEYLVNHNIDLGDPVYFKSLGSNIYQNRIKYFDDGTVGAILVAQFGYADAMPYEYYTIAIYVKFDASGNVTFITPLGINGTDISDIRADSNNNFSFINDDGSFSVVMNGTLNKIYNFVSGNFSTGDNLQFPIPDSIKVSESGMPAVGPYVIEFDKDGNVTNLIRLATYSRESQYIDSSTMYNSVYSYNAYPLYLIKDGDGYIVVDLTNADTPYQALYDEDKRTLFLDNGNKLVLNEYDRNTAYLVYRVNKDSKVDWIKQIYGVENTSYFMHQTTNIVNDSFAIAIPSLTKEIVDIDDEDSHTPVNGNTNNDILIAKFKVNREELPVAQQVINLELFNFRKQYTINVQSNDSNNVLFNIKEISTGDENITNNPGDIDIVKHGDDSNYLIKITPSQGYYVKSIKINNDEVNFKSSIDGVVNLDRITNVTEAKNVYVELERYSSKVLVHHYISGTTIPIAPDETITGDYGDPYETYPANSSEYEVVKDANNQYILPDNMNGYFTTEPIEVTYYYLAYGNLKVNYIDKDTYKSLHDPLNLRGVKGSNYSTSPIDIVLYQLTGVDGDENGQLNSSFAEVNYLYTRLNKTLITTKFIDKDTNLSVADPVTDYYDRGLTYYTYKLATDPQYYEYVSSSGNESGEAQGDEIIVIYYYQKLKGTVTTKHLDAVTLEPIATDNVETLTYGSNYQTSKLSTIPNDYTFLSVTGTEQGTVNSPNILVTYYYKPKSAETPKYGRVISRYVDVETGKDIGISNIQNLLYGTTYTGVRPSNGIDGYELVSIIGDETGIVDRDNIEISYRYRKKDITIIIPEIPKKDDDTSSIIPKEDTPNNSAKEPQVIEVKTDNPKTSDDIYKYLFIFAGSIVLILGFTIPVVVKKIKNKKRSIK